MFSSEFRNVRLKCLIYNLLEMRPNKFNVVGSIGLSEIIVRKGKIYAVPVSLRVVKNTLGVDYI